MERAMADGQSLGNGSEIEQGVFEGVVDERRAADLIHDFAPMQEATDVAGLFAGLARAVVGAVRGDACLISILSEDGHILRDVAASVQRPARLNVVAEQYILNDFPLTRSVIENRHSAEISVNDPDGDAAEIENLKELGFDRLLMSPLVVENEVIGTVECYRKVDRAFRQNDPNEIEVLTAFAGSAYSRIQLAEKLEEHYTMTMEALTSALEARDPYTEAHTSRIKELAVGLAIAMQVPEEILKSVRLGSILHDVGKIGVSDSILLKAGPLTDEEWETMRAHPEIGERMLQGIEFLRPAMPVIRHHHERWDGMGYPDRLEAEDIPLAARIVAVCDAYDAMTTDRPYRKGMSHEAACEELIKCAGKQHDPMCTSLLIDVVSHLGDDSIEERFVRYSA
jgi:HD-GYP domain-containing protein (c-di-GMP phosphodiesterase class II)